MKESSDLYPSRCFAPKFWYWCFESRIFALLSDTPVDNELIKYATAAFYKGFMSGTRVKQRMSRFYYEWSSV